MCFGTPNRSIFSSASGKAASLDAVENATRNGWRTAYQNRALGTFATANAGISTSATNRINAKYNVLTSFPRPNKTAIPFEPMVTAMAAPTPNGATYITYFV